MKMPSPFSNNAIFHACVRSNLRQSRVLGVVVVLASTLVIIAAATYVGNDPGTNFYLRLLLPLYVIQGLILLIGVGTLSGVVGVERNSGTLDCHRLSPQPRAIIAVGLLFGTPILELLIAALMMPATVLVGYAAGVSFMALLSWQISLFMSALALYALVLVCVLNLSKENIAKKTPGLPSLLLGLFIMTMILPISFTLPSFLGPYSPVYHTFSPHALAQLFSVIKNEADNYRPYAVVSPSLTPLASLALQAIFQIPILMFLLWAATRKLHHPTRSALSKTQAFVLTGIAFCILLTELCLADDLHQPTAYHVLALTPLATLLGICCAHFTTPTRLLHLRYKLQGMSGVVGFRRLMSDGASNIYWLAGHMALTLTAAVCVWALFRFRGVSSEAAYSLRLLPYLCFLSLAQVACFAGLNELRFLEKRPWSANLFNALIAVVWALLPFLGFILGEAHYLFRWVGAALSPVAAPFYIVYAADNMTRTAQARTQFAHMLVVTVMVNALLACLFLALAARKRKQVV